MTPSSSIPILHADAVRALLPRLDTQNILRAMFRDLAQQTAVQPPQTLALFPSNGGDFISYLGVLASQSVFGVKLSPYVPRPQGPLVTAWSLLMSMATGQPLMLCEAGLLTVERTAATTAIAVDALAPANARILCVVGLGALGQAHVRHALALREWREIRLHAPNLAQLPEATRDSLRAMDPRIQLVESLPAATQDADVLMLCTSSSSPVLSTLPGGKPCLVTSISTNGPSAHEIAPSLLPQLQVYCDYRATTPDSASEMKIACAEHGWNTGAIMGDLPELMAGTCPLPQSSQSVFFRSIGLGLEDIAVAAALYELTLQ
ncbi:MAG: ornithine cyclodeaminase family protein [Burkholderiales bacterium]|nr:ornithine cyclodeaminase family protein [Burkholderiales bacterium]